MKKILFILAAVLSLLVTRCGNTNNKGTAGSAGESQENVKIVFSEYEHDFGKVAEGEKVGFIFVFENKGTADLVISSATSSCGCTVPKFDKKPIPPGKTGELEVVFDTSGRNGIQTKTIAVRSNASKPVVLLKITAEVVNKNK
jgi:Protein of unknown function (DUF1573)